MKDLKITYVNPEFKLTPAEVLKRVWSNDPIIINTKLFEDVKGDKNEKRKGK